MNFIPPPNSSLLGHAYWFNEMWEQSTDWNGEFINEILSKAPIVTKRSTDIDVELTEKLTPYEVYIKYLQSQFGDVVDTETTDLLKSYLPVLLVPLEYV